MKKIHSLIISLFVTISGIAQDNRIWSTYFGGPANEVSPAGGPYVATDPSGNVYLTGYTYSSSGIAAGGFQNTFGGTIDAFLVKYNSFGTRLWSTYYGGNEADYIYGLTTDAQGNVYMAGKTASDSAFATGGFQNSFGGGIFDAFLVKFDSAGNRLWSTYYGGPGDDSGEGIAVDGSGNIYLSGTTSSSSNIAATGFQNSLRGIRDAFLVKFNSSGVRVWGTYYGGNAADAACGTAVDTAGNIYVVGNTSSDTGIASAGFQNIYGGSADAFLVKFNASGNRLWATYYGGNGSDRASALTIGRSGNVYIAGNTQSVSGIALNGVQNSLNGGNSLGDAFAAKFNSSGNRLWGTYYGGSNDDYALSIATDTSENIYLSGDTYSPTGIASGGFQNTLAGTENEFVLKIDANSKFLCATYYGVDHDEDGRVAVDGFGNLYLAGATPSTTGIASGGFQNASGGGMDAYLAKFTTSCQDAVNIEEVLSSPFFTIYPNPNHGSFILKAEGQLYACELILVNSTGQQVYSKKISQGENAVNTGSLTNGMYHYILLNNGQKEGSGKLTIR